MFKHILVPLDGSRLAETALVPAASMSKTLSAPVTLLHIIEKDAPQAIHHDHHLTRADEASAYLNETASRAFPAGTQVEAHVHAAAVQDVAASIIQHASEEYNPDLIVMCAHGQGGFRDFVFGNIAQQVLSGGETPLLLLQPHGIKPHPFSLRRILVPLDNESLHDESLEYARELARAYTAELYLLTVVPTYSTLTGQEAAVGNLLPATAAAYLEIQEETAREHLQEHLNECLASGLETSAEIGRGDPADVIVSTAARLHADLILLGTHRKAGMSAFWARSVAPNVVKRAPSPLLLIPLRKK